MNIALKSVLCLIAILVGSVTEGLPVDSVIAFSLIVVFGIPHGATDHILNNFIQNKEIDGKPSIAFLTKYLLVIALYGLLWVLLPSLSLLIFLTISAFHFVEAQFQMIRTNVVLKYTASFSWGVAALAILLFTKASALSLLIVPHLISEDVMQVLIEYRLFLVSASIALALGLSLVISPRMFIKELIELGLLFTIALNTSLLFAFATFFAFWHSRDAVAHQLSLLKPVKLDLKTWIKLATPYSLMSVFGIGMMLILFGYTSTDFPLVTAFFVLVALITLPHVIVMSTFYRRA